MKKFRFWRGLSSVLSFFLITMILIMDCMMGYAGTVNSALGIVTSKVVNNGDTEDDTAYFESEYGELSSENLQTLIQDTYDESVLEEEEGAVLLKNDKNALPLTMDETQITLFGHAVAQPLYKASSAGSNGYKGEYCIDLYNAMKNAGFSINDTLYNAYAASETKRGTGAFDFITQTTSEFSMGEESIDFYTEDLQNSWAEGYNDVAIVMLAREGGEGTELLTSDPEGISQLALHQDEKDLLQMIKDSDEFSKTIVLINSGWAMELDWLDDYDVDACLWIGCPGQRGFEGVANLLTGKATPSGSLTDTYAVNSLSAPAVVNGSGNNQNWENLDEVLSKTTEGESDVSWYTVQAEGIYVGYKYYETRYEALILGQGNANAEVGSSTNSQWNYNSEVSYPFGYGLSYTSFTEKLENVEMNGDQIKVTVTVKNTGNVNGKKSVQIYAQTPYGEYEKENLVEKSSIQLLDFGKTRILAPGESETITVECDKYLLTSYDYTNSKGYILSEGQYYIAVGDHAHDALNNILTQKGATGMVDLVGNVVSGNSLNVYEWTEKFDAETYNLSQYTQEEVTNQFEDCDINYWNNGAVTYLSRNDWEKTYPKSAVKVKASEEMIELLNGEYYVKAADAKSVSEYTLGEKNDIPLAALKGADYDDELWETYLNQFTLEELALLTADNFGTAEIADVGKPAVIVGDGPDGVGGTFNEEIYGDGRTDTCFPCELILASTFNKDLLKRRGELMGEESLYLGMATVWMPGGNIHRTPFGGRNFEYYSEDSVMNYLCEIPEIKAMESKGVHSGIKHLVGNDQENNRQGISVFFNEQGLREGSLRGFEGALAVAGGKAVMHGFNRLGLVWCSSSATLCTQIVENEWGFVGQQETDAIASGEPYKAHFATSLAAGTDTYCLDFSKLSTAAFIKQINETDDGFLLGKLREAAHDYLYTIANSAVMNGFSADSKVISITPWWQPVMYIIIALLAIMDLYSIIMLKKKKNKNLVLVEEVQEA
ncbi:MAG: glycoside hydrolase family 3 protein [Lachnospiraceae bacterium]|nr:glycoside hydrolase family 3 protein [Lachnospiraceae bacterium]